MSSARDRQRAHRERQARGIGLFTVALSEIDLADYLIRCNALDELKADDRDAIERALQNCLAALIKRG